MMGKLFTPVARSIDVTVAFWLMRNELSSLNGKEISPK